MSGTVLSTSIYKVSEDAVTRKIAGELVIVPLVTGVGGMDDELFTLNQTGEAIWEHLDGKNSIQQIVASLCDRYEAAPEIIEDDVKGIVAALLERNLVVETSGV